MQENIYKKAKNKREAEIFEWAGSMVVALIFFVTMFTFFLRLVVVNGISMQPTFMQDDWVLLNSFLYTPKKGDVVVVSNLDNIGEPIIKRVIATENDKLRIDDKQGKVYINDVLQDDDVCYNNVPTSGGDTDIPEVIPEGYIFVMGDNRENSFDSRYKMVGLIKKEKVVGKAQAIIFPFVRMKVYS